MMTLLDKLDWSDLARQLDVEGYALTPQLLDASTCQFLAASYDDASTAFRSTVVMARHGFGRGEYKYFARPLPPVVEALRKEFYGPLATIANSWSDKFGQGHQWPETLSALEKMCHDAGQTRPTPLLLKYGAGDYNCLHQDLYGEIHFPFQLVILLDRPGIDFDGGELVLVEQRPRMQSRPAVVPLRQGMAAIIPVRERPCVGSRGIYRTQMRHGVSQIRSGTRRTLGIIFHDAA